MKATSWVWEIHYEDGQTYVALCKTPTRYEMLSGLVGILFNLCIPGTYSLCNKLIKWLDTKITVKYKFPIGETELRIIDPDSF
jgi:hypothetical protein